MKKLVRQEFRSSRKIFEWFVRSFVHSFVVREEECEEAGSFVVVRVLASELALSAAGPCVPRRHVPCRQDTRQPTEPREVPFSFISFHLGFCVCVCREASSAK